MAPQALSVQQAHCSSIEVCNPKLTLQQRPLNMDWSTQSCQFVSIVCEHLHQEMVKKKFATLNALHRLRYWNSDENINQDPKSKSKYPINSQVVHDHAPLCTQLGERNKMWKRWTEMAPKIIRALTIELIPMVKRHSKNS